MIERERWSGTWHGKRFRGTLPPPPPAPGQQPEPWDVEVRVRLSARWCFWWRWFEWIPERRHPWSVSPGLALFKVADGEAVRSPPAVHGEQ